jgi:hypothetical protein
MTNIKTLSTDIVKALIATVQDQVTRFPEGTSQHTLQVNRLKALKVALAISQNESVSKEDLRAALAPLESLISKSEKALTRLKPNSWQAQRLQNNLDVLEPILEIIRERLNAESTLN